MKKLFLIVALLIHGIAMFAQDHVVARGESLQSIADKYNVSLDKIIEANPGVDKLFYVGLVLTVPENESAMTRQSETVESVTVQMQDNGSEQLTPDAVNQTNDVPGFEPSMMMEYGFLSKAEGVSGSNYTYAISVGANYYLMHKDKGVFAGARIGYNSANYNNTVKVDRGEYQNTTSTAHFIAIPINMGYALTNDNSRLGISPYAGIGFNFCVGGKIKSKGRIHGENINGEEKFKKKVGVDARVGLQLRLWGFNIGGSYVFPLNDSQKSYFGKDAYPAINIGFGF